MTISRRWKRFAAVGAVVPVALGAWVGWHYASAKLFRTRTVTTTRTISDQEARTTAQQDFDRQMAVYRKQLTSPDPATLRGSSASNPALASAAASDADPIALTKELVVPPARRGHKGEFVWESAATRANSPKVTKLSRNWTLIATRK